MEKQKSMSRIVYVIIAIIIIAGGIICVAKGFNIELLYSNRQEIIISNATGFDKAKIEEISNEILQGKKVKVQEVERFGNAVVIISTEITEEEKENIINKVNEQYDDANISNEDIDIIKIANTRIRDIIRPYILPGLISFVLVFVYLAIVYRKKIGIGKVLTNCIFIPIITELTYYSIIAIVRIPFGRITSGIAIGLYVISIGALMMKLQNQKLPENDKKEND